MSTTFQNISYNLIDGIFDALTGKVTYNTITYPVYKSIPKPPAATYVWVGGVIETSDGTKDDFMYKGTVQVQVVSETNERVDMKLAQGISGIVRGLLKATKSSTLTLTTNTLVIFTPESSTEFVDLGTGIPRIKIVDIYNFICE